MHMRSAAVNINSQPLFTPLKRFLRLSAPFLWDDVGCASLYVWGRRSHDLVQWMQTAGEL